MNKPTKKLSKLENKLLRVIRKHGDFITRSQIRLTPVDEYQHVYLGIDNSTLTDMLVTLAKERYLEWNGLKGELAAWRLSSKGHSVLIR